MNETVLNGLLNLFALFASMVRLDDERALQAVHTYLFSHFGVRQRDEHIGLYGELRGIYDSPLQPPDKAALIENVCVQIKARLTALDQFLLLLRFVEFVFTCAEYDAHRDLFLRVGAILGVTPNEYSAIEDFVAGRPSSLFITIGGDGGKGCIVRERLNGTVTIFPIVRFNRFVFVWRGSGMIFMNDLAVTPGMFYTWPPGGVLKGPLMAPVYGSDLKAMADHKERGADICLEGRGVEFCFKNSRHGIHNFEFNLASGQLVAIMGGSGVGKSTLLSLMNGSLTPDQGSITVNGHPVSSAEVRRLIGFVPQDDMLMEELTVYQNLWYTARLSFARLTEEETARRVNEVLQELDLYDIRSLRVGSVICKSISGGQRKRLNIALELIRHPAVLYVDEPTSGLSSGDSEKVLMLLKEQAHRGRLVVVNIHQPASEIYKLFDRLWLLDRGGWPIYDGHPIEAITSFKQMARYTDQQISMCASCGSVNPELILQIVDAKQVDDQGKETDIRKFSPQEWHQEYLSRRPALPQVEVKPLPEDYSDKPSRWQQFLVFSKRNLAQKLTNKPYLALALLEAPLLALVVALLTRFAADGQYTLYGNKNLVSYIFMAVIVVTFMGMSVSAEEIIRDRPLLRRERFLQLSRGSYLMSKMVYLLFLSGIQALLFILVGNGLIEIPADRFPIWWGVLWITAFLANLTGLFLSRTLASAVAIYITIPLLLIPQILLCGLVVRFDDLQSSRPMASDKVPLVGQVIPARWAFEALVVDQFCNNAHNRPFFTAEKEKFLAQYYGSIHLEEVQTLAEQLKKEPSLSLEATVRNELHILARAARMPLPANFSGQENYDSCLIKIKQALTVRAHNYTAYLNRLQQDEVRRQGETAFLGNKLAHHNAAIEQLVTNATARRLVRPGHHRLYPQTGQVYFEPDNRWGRAPFYAHKKNLAGWSFSTLAFNLSVLCLFVVLATMVIFVDFPAHFFPRRRRLD